MSGKTRVAVFGAAIAVLLSGLACQKAQSPPKTYNVYYFYRTIRCPSCEKIEALAKQSVEQTFAKGLASGRMTWRTINIDLPEYKHFEADYRLMAQSVVVSEVQDGKETRWKNLEKVWDLLDNDADFVRYVQDEIRAFGQLNQ